jgi:N-acetyl-anhydromuramyl-L-alanine amidase AmpD
MKILNIIKQLPWKGSNGKMNLKNIDTLVVHHDAVAIPRAYNTLERIKNEAKAHIANNWGHFSYHYVIDNVGDIYQCVPEDEIGYHAGNLAVNKKSIAVCLHGNFQTQQPTAKQVKALQEFCTHMFTKRPDLPKIVKSSLKGHREVRVSPTACPGNNLFPLVVKIRK